MKLMRGALNRGSTGTPAGAQRGGFSSHGTPADDDPPAANSYYKHDDQDHMFGDRTSSSQPKPHKPRRSAKKFFSKFFQFDSWFSASAFGGRKRGKTSKTRADSHSGRTGPLSGTSDRNESGNHGDLFYRAAEENQNTREDEDYHFDLFDGRLPVDAVVQIDNPVLREQMEDLLRRMEWERQRELEEEVMLSSSDSEEDSEDGTGSRED
ncbi:unnamed protein product [Amoebophrya sp. A120]|nr:unnamed protein product [Amoebophrya sp. A120]|eukprot:GSA120T00004685001.1